MIESKTGTGDNRKTQLLDVNVAHPVAHLYDIVITIYLYDQMTISINSLPVFSLHSLIVVLFPGPSFQLLCAFYTNIQHGEKISRSSG
jgi:hypothetical protein